MIIKIYFTMFHTLSLVLATILLVIGGAKANIFNVLNFGAVGDGVTDDTRAFTAAWAAICNAGTDTSTLIIPEGKLFFVRQTTFLGPCKTINLNIQLSGRIIAPDGPSQWRESDVSRWLTFTGVSRLNIFGAGVIDGRGQGWWDISCKYHPQLKGCGKLAPSAFLFHNCKNLNIKQISLINSPQAHIHLKETSNVELSWLKISAPRDSPNTDGIHIEIASFVSIHDSHIGSGDDCISIGDSTSNIHVTNIDCGPGHGISIGSLGETGSREVQVEEIHVSFARFIGTTNGVRIKTWQVGKGKAQHISFSNLNFTAVENPIIIDQYYCSVPFACAKTQTGVHISDVSYSNAFGTSASKVAINLNCSNAMPCTNVVLDNVSLTSSVPGNIATASCNYAHGSSLGIVTPSSCLQT